MPDGGDESGSDLTTACPSGAAGLDPAPVIRQLPPRTQRLPRSREEFSRPPSPSPTQLHGDLPATMKATYADGTNAGPADWTPYQQFGYLFSHRACAARG
ncbi:hypothetical protein, partial [Streptomyces mirabilis]|uniref:hypothetical protein n=1 Tax=Streptomyces mirabilis TaxID=68239 RepID=UPI00368BF84A